jgi:DNA-binding transcriptional MocR family regulator
MPPDVDALKLYHEGLEHDISITPGPLFTLTSKFGSNIRLSAAYLDEKVERAIETLGKLATKR